MWEIVGNGDNKDGDNDIDLSRPDWKERLQDFDAVVLAAGSGLFSTPTPKNDSTSSSSSVLSRADFPLKLVRSQSIEIRVPNHVDADRSSTLVWQVRLSFAQ
jgi:hypothetical protein